MHLTMYHIQKRKEEKKHMKKNTKKKFRDIRNAVVMMCVMVAMMSTASYAWFTMTSSPTVTNMTMTAASTGGLQISNSENTGFADAIVAQNTDVEVLKPVTPDIANPGTFQAPVYSGNEVVRVSALESITDYVAKYTYYLKSTATASAKELNIGIVCGDVDQVGDMGVSGQTSNLKGSIVRKTSASTSDYVHYAIRVGIVPAGSSTMYIWEPNNNGTMATATVADDSTGINLEEHVSSVMAGTIDGGTVGPSSLDNKTSKGLFTMTEGSTKQVDVYVWLEGTDPQCANEIQAGELEVQLQFTVVDEPATP